MHRRERRVDADDVEIWWAATVVQIVRVTTEAGRPPVQA